MFFVISLCLSSVRRCRQLTIDLNDNSSEISSPILKKIHTNDSWMALY